MPLPISAPTVGVVSLGDTWMESEETTSNPESHTFVLPVVGGSRSLLPRRAGVRARTLESGPGPSLKKKKKNPVPLSLVILLRGGGGGGCCGGDV